MLAPEYFNNHIDVAGEIVVGTVNNAQGTILTINPVTKKISTRTHAQIIADLNLLTIYDDGTYKGIESNKPFAIVNLGGASAQSAYMGGLLVSNAYADSQYMPTNGIFSKGLIRTADNLETNEIAIGSVTNKLRITRQTSSMVGILSEANGWGSIKAEGFFKNNSDNNHLLLGAGSDKAVSDFETSWVNSGRDFPNGTLITTNIDYSQTYGSPWLLEIKGNMYGGITPLDAKMQGYIYNDTIIQYGGYSTYSPLVYVTALNISGFLCFWFPSMGYWQGFSVRVSDSSGGTPTTINRVISIQNSSDPGGTKRVDIYLQHVAFKAWVTENYALKDGSNATEKWINSSNGLEANPTIVGKMYNASGASNLANATYGSVAGYLNTHGISNGNPSDNWWYRMKFLHPNSEGFYGELGIQMTDGNSFQYKKVQNGVDSGWVEVWDKLKLPYNHVDYLAYLFNEGAATQANLLNYIPLTQKGAANGVATLDGSGLIPTNQIPGYHTHSNLANLDSINQNLGTTNLPTFSSLRVNSSLPFLHGADGSTNLFIIGADNAIGGGASNTLSYYAYGSGGYHKFYQNVEMIADLKVDNIVTAVNGFIKQGGTSNQFLKADGSVDSNTYSTSTQLDTKVSKSGDTITGALNINSSSLVGMWRGGTNDTNYLIWRNYGNTKDIAYIGADGNSAVGGGVGDGFGIVAPAGKLHLNGFDGVFINGLIPWTNGSFSQNDINNWITSFGWGNHANAGYLTSSSLNGYATQAWTQSLGYITASALNGYATQNYVGQTYIPQTHVTNGITSTDIINWNNAHVWVQSILPTYVSLGTNQVLTGLKEFTQPIHANAGVASGNYSPDEIFVGDTNVANLSDEIINEDYNLRFKPFDERFGGTYNSFQTRNRFVNVTLRDGGDIIMEEVWLHQTILIMNTSDNPANFSVNNTSYSVGIEPKRSITLYVNVDGEVIQIADGLAYKL